MPLYDYHCHKCGRNESDVFHPIKDCHKPRNCKVCGQQMSRRLGCGIKNPNMWNYYSENLQAHITSAGHRDRLMKERGVIEVGSDMVRGTGLLTPKKVDF